MGDSQPIRYLSLCSGIEAATVAWHPLGWVPVGFSEKEPFPSAVLRHHYPDVPNFGRMEDHETWPVKEGDIDLLVAGCPCQAFSVAGLRQGLRDPRGGLTLTFVEIAQRLRPRWVVYENVPGLLSSGRGRDFGSLLGALSHMGYRWSFRVLDAAWVRSSGFPRAVPQRRRRLFLVGNLGDWSSAAEVLLVGQSLSWDPRASKTERQETEQHPPAFARNVSSKWAKGTGGPAGDECYNLIVPPAEQTGDSGFGVFRKSKRARSTSDFETWVEADEANTINVFDSGERDTHAVCAPPAVRRITVLECERLMGLPDNYTAIPWRGKPAHLCPDGPRFKAIGNSMAVNCMQWIGERIQQVASGGGVLNAS